MSTHSALRCAAHHHPAQRRSLHRAPLRRVRGGPGGTVAVAKTANTSFSSSRGFPFTYLHLFAPAQFVSALFLSCLSNSSPFRSCACGLPSSLHQQKQLGLAAPRCATHCPRYCLRRHVAPPAASTTATRPPAASAECMRSYDGPRLRAAPPPKATKATVAAAVAPEAAAHHTSSARRRETTTTPAATLTSET